MMRALFFVLAFAFIIWLYVQVVSPLLEQAADALKQAIG
jgi:hypothetical protein